MNATATEVQNGKTARQSEVQKSFKSWDGTELFYRAWLPAKPADKALILFHRGHEHSGRFQETVKSLDLEDTAAFAWDERGHGRSPGERGYAESFSALVRDADCFVKHISKEHGIPVENMVILGHSVGAVLVAAWVHDYAPKIRGMILGTPALRIKLYIPFAIPLLRILQKIKPKSFIKSYVKATMLTHDPIEAAKYDGDPLISRNIAVNILLDLHDLSTRIMRDAGAIRVPTLLLVSGSDWVVKKSSQDLFFDRISSAHKERIVYDGFHHAIFHEKDRHLPLAETRKFICGLFSRAPRRLPLVHADEAGYTKSEFDGLSQPLPAFSPGAIQFALTRASMQTLGQLSKGIRIGWQTGFDSGESLDCVYRNTPEGITPIGRALDRSYLNSIGWKGIRVRKIHLEQLLDGAIQKVRESGKPIRLADIASGPGRYMLDTLRRHKGLDISAVLRDRSKGGLEAGRLLASELGVSNVTYLEGDAFDPASLAQISPRPNIAIVSGLYELFPGNDLVSKSLGGLHDVLQHDGYLIYTNQPWHPQVEMIARVLINRDRKPWIMRRRTQEEMDDLVEAAGFKKLEMQIDEWGIFTVSLAQRV